MFKISKVERYTCYNDVGERNFCLGFRVHKNMNLHKYPPTYLRLLPSLDKHKINIAFHKTNITNSERLNEQIAQMVNVSNSLCCNDVKRVL